MHPGDPVTAIVWGVIPALVLLAIVYWLDRYEKEPLRFLGIALIGGAIVAPFIAVILEENVFDIRSSAFVSTTVPLSVLTPWTPIVEEVVRGLVILAVFFIVRREVDDLLDGLVYGAVVGIGFAMAANFWAIIQAPDLGQSITDQLPGIMVAGFNHVFYGAVIGLALAAARRSSIPVVLGAWLLGVDVAAQFHLVHDYLPSWIASDAEPASSAGLIANIPNVFGLLALAALVMWLLGREKVLVGRELQEEVAAGVVTPDDYAAVTNSFRRFGSLAGSMGKGGQWRLRRRLYVLEVELAFRKHMQRNERARAEKFRDEETYRQEIVETRNELLATSGATTGTGASGTTGTTEGER